MVVTSVIRIASTISSVPSGLLLHYFRHTVAVASSVVIVDLGLWLWGRIVSPRHSRYIVIRVDASVISISTRATWGTVIAIPVHIPSSN